MSKSSSRPRRKITRLKGFDYTQPGTYFLTTCCAGRIERFGAICDQTMVLNPVGEIAEACWKAIPEHFPHIQLDDFVVMPNHVHGILWITERPNGVRANLPRTFGGSIKGSISTIAGTYKGAVTQIAHDQGFLLHVRLWQSRFWDRVCATMPPLRRSAPIFATTRLHGWRINCIRTHRQIGSIHHRVFAGVPTKTFVGDPGHGSAVTLRESSSVTTDTAVPMSLREHPSVATDTAVPMSLRGYSPVNTDTAVP